MDSWSSSAFILFAQRSHSPSSSILFLSVFLSQIPVNVCFVASSTFNVWLIIAVVVSQWTTQETLASVHSCRFFVVQYCAGHRKSTGREFFVPTRTHRGKAVKSFLAHPGLHHTWCNVVGKPHQPPPPDVFSNIRFLHLLEVPELNRYRHSDGQTDGRTLLKSLLIYKIITLSILLTRD